MKFRVYLRIGKTNPRKSKSSRYRVDASKYPDFKSLTNYNDEPIPTVQVALDLDIPDSEFDAAKILLETKIKDTKPCIEIKQVEQNNGQ